jgi:hypothetical protein
MTKLIFRVVRVLIREKIRGKKREMAAGGGTRELLLKEYNDAVEKKGYPPTLNQMLALAEKKNLPLSKSKIAELYRKFGIVAKYSEFRRPKKFQTLGDLRYGDWFIDYAEFRKDLAGSNDGRRGFLVAVENLTNRLFVMPTKAKATEDWQMAIENFLDLHGGVRMIRSDRDSVATSQVFRERMEKKFGIRWMFLVKGSKSYLAERYIRFMKTALSKMLTLRRSKKWLQFVKPIVDAYNGEKIAGTAYRRNRVTRENFLDFAGQVLKMKDPELAFNSCRVGPFAQDSINKQIFKFKVGDRVLLAIEADWKKKRSGFYKKSVEGGFTRSSDQGKRFTVSGRQLKVTKGYRGLVQGRLQPHLSITYF